MMVPRVILKESMKCAPLNYSAVAIVVIRSVSPHNTIPIPHIRIPHSSIPSFPIPPYPGAQCHCPGICKELGEEDRQLKKSGRNLASPR